MTNGENRINALNINQLSDFVEQNQPLFVLTGAGCSTASGIPDYRDEEGEWKHHRPVQFQDFVAQESIRQRYWARSMYGWPHINNASPADVHLALGKLEQAGIIEYLVTQNVDGLHQKAGSSRVLDLHGNLETVGCLSCGWQISREKLQHQLVAANADFSQLEAQLGPDGDALIENLDFSSFNLISCPQCGGILKPEVVFFGESVPKSRVSLAMKHLQNAGALLVVGSSLMVFSGFRFCRAAGQANKQICIINKGRTRADNELNLKIEADCSETLNQLILKLGL